MIFLGDLVTGTVSLHGVLNLEPVIGQVLTLCGMDGVHLGVILDPFNELDELDESVSSNTAAIPITINDCAGWFYHLESYLSGVQEAYKKLVTNDSGHAKRVLNVLGKVAKIGEIMIRPCNFFYLFCVTQMLQNLACRPKRKKSLQKKTKKLT